MLLHGVQGLARTSPRILHILRTLLVLHALAQSAVAQPAPLERAHAHNDYEHARPLFDALERGFNSVEADVHLVDGRLLVAARTISTGCAPSCLHAAGSASRRRCHLQKAGKTIAAAVAPTSLAPASRPAGHPQPTRP